MENAMLTEPLSDKIFRHFKNMKYYDGKWFPDLPYVEIDGELRYHPEQWFFQKTPFKFFYGLKAGYKSRNDGRIKEGINTDWRVDYIHNNDKMPLKTFGDLLMLLDYFEIKYSLSYRKDF